MCYRSVISCGSLVFRNTQVHNCAIPSHLSSNDPPFSLLHLYDNDHPTDDPTPVPCSTSTSTSTNTNTNTSTRRSARACRQVGPSACCAAAFSAAAFSAAAFSAAAFSAAAFSAAAFSAAACHPHHPGQYLALCRLSGVRFGGLDIEPLCR